MKNIIPESMMKRMILVFFSCFLLDTIGIFTHRDYNLLSYILFGYIVLILENKRSKFMKNRKAKKEKAC